MEFFGLLCPDMHGPGDLTRGDLGMKKGQTYVHRKAGGEWAVCTLMEWRQLSQWVWGRLGKVQA